MLPKHPHITKPTHTHPHITKPTHTHPHITNTTVQTIQNTVNTSTHVTQTTHTLQQHYFTLVASFRADWEKR